MELLAFDLFAGSRSFSNTAELFGIKTFAVDWAANLPGIDYRIDIMDFDCEMVERVFGVPDFIWASPDCAAWSNAAGNRHIVRGELVSEKAKKSKAAVLKTLEIIRYFINKNPNLVFWIENPLGKLQKQDFILENIQPSIFAQGSGNYLPMRKVVIDQCQYGREFLKPTVIFTNDKKWKPLARCKGKDRCHHIPDGFNTKSSSSNYERRAKLPGALFVELLKNFIPKNSIIL